MAIPIPESCVDCWPSKIEAARGATKANLCPLIARAALQKHEVPGQMDALIARLAPECRDIGSRTVSQVVEGPRKIDLLRTAANNLAA